MGIDVIRLGNLGQPIGPDLNYKDLADISYQRFHVPNPSMRIWLMTLSREKKIFPWWSYQGVLDEDIESLNNLWNVTNAQHLFDLLFLNQMYRFGGMNFFVIFSGSIKSSGWNQISKEEQELFLKGQGCNYRLEGLYKSKMSINWVPFFQPQSLVRRPPFKSMWKIFLNQDDENDEASSMTFFALKDLKKLPEVVKLMINKEEKRSELLLDMVDWYGLYSSPRRPSITTAAVVYTKNDEVIKKLTEMEKVMLKQFEQAKKDLLEKAVPSTAIKILNRHILI